MTSRALPPFATTHNYGFSWELHLVNNRCRTPSLRTSLGDISVEVIFAPHGQLEVVIDTTAPSGSAGRGVRLSVDCWLLGAQGQYLGVGSVPPGAPKPWPIGGPQSISIPWYYLSSVDAAARHPASICEAAICLHIDHSTVVPPLLSPLAPVGLVSTLIESRVQTVASLIARESDLYCSEAESLLLS